MTRSRPTPGRSAIASPFGLGIETLLLILVLASAGAAAWTLWSVGSLPQPFFYDTDDTFMDWFNTAYWGNHYDPYTAWKTVYPPFSFVFVRLFSQNSCYVVDSIVGRHCDWVGIPTIIAFYCLDVALVYRSFRLNDVRTATIRTLAVAFGLPMLYTVERGNLIIVCFCFFVLGFGPVLRHAWMRWIALAMSINLKPYIVVVLMSYLVRRRWRWLEGCGLALIAVYLGSYALEGVGDPLKIVTNTLDFAFNLPSSFLIAEAFYSTSYTPALEFLKSDFPIVGLLGSGLTESIEFVLPALIRIGQLGVVVAFAGAVFRPTAIPLRRLGALSLALVITSTDPGGYTQLFLVFLVLFEPWIGLLNITMLVCVYGLSLSADMEILSIQHVPANVFLSGRVVDYHLGVGVGAVLRPLLILIIEYCLVLSCLRDLWRKFASKAFGGRGDPTPGRPANSAAGVPD
jgi:hypothetical protein